MGRPTRPVFPLFRSQLYADVAFQVFNAPAPLSLKQLMDLVGASRPTIAGIVDELVEASIVEDHPIGRTRQISANTEAPFHEPLLQLLTIVEGPQVVVEEVLRDLLFVRGALIYGSWAARAHGVRGHSPRDIDLLVVSDAKLTTKERVLVHERLEIAEHRLRREVNPLFATLDQWRESEDAFLSTIHSSPLVEVITVDP